ncbi:olfactory receptor 5V1-like [Pleurodeles waltl]|uniref:olfactory receptor 5V1-like n=1 Tax=Pleurodeles waltl TaxID=8319 RepID=UPI003709A146
MDIRNKTNMKYFILQGLSDNPKHQTALFALFLTIYFVGIVSNSDVMAAIVTDLKLHSPIYSFIWNLSLMDICVLTTIVPQLFIITISKTKTISYTCCIAQLYIFVGIETIDSLLFGVMAYDRYVAICRPLHYLKAMDRKVCVLLAACSWVGGLLNSLLYSTMIIRLSFCASNLIQSFFCDMPPLLKLSCSDTSINELLILTEGTCVALVSIVTIVFSYICIVSTVLSIRSSEGRSKAFSNCSSHLVVITLYYGTILFTDVRPSSSYTLKRDKAVTVIYTIVTPMLSPFIYSLRNEQMKKALKNMMGRCIIF